VQSLFLTMPYKRLWSWMAEREGAECRHLRDVRMRPPQALAGKAQPMTAALLIRVLLIAGSRRLLAAPAFTKQDYADLLRGTVNRD
jgi:hypothetical protein